MLKSLAETNPFNARCVFFALIIHNERKRLSYKRKKKFLTVDIMSVSPFIFAACNWDIIPHHNHVP